ncbi:hypothetical protein [Leptospira sp. GIMC2001]|uniref:hypothetical protein n=1 Tax=Leptospira sp. GIMC2001 TaxID=1513297 RepID=UPI0023494C2C|nr:hypothetical protein [Leptospira sp. GIMC2001]WCL51511.1 hypothetical protein O4O04_20050 [Leptospira sp. GIMC2001]
MQKAPNAQDLAFAPILNQITVPHTAGAVSLNEEDRFYAITEVRAAGAWTCAYKNSDPNADDQNRNGSGNQLFPVPWIVERAVFTDVTEVSGYFIPAMKVGR